MESASHIHAKINKESKRWVRTGIDLAELPGAEFLNELETVARNFQVLEWH